jgi:hypothetical protein
MSKEQLTEQQVEVVGTERDSAAPAQTHGLPPHVYAQVMALGPADAPALADLLTSFPDLSVRILTVASPHMGNAAVQRAITIAQKQSAQGKAGTLSQAEMHEVLDDKPAQGKAGTLSQAEMHEVLDDKPAQGKAGTLSQAEMHEVLDDKPAQGKAGTLSQAEMHEVLDDKPASAEPAWVGGARKYNAAHAEFVSDFNELTNNSCLDAAGQLDPQAVARWQRQHGVEADGKIGPHTVAAARAAQVKAGSAGAIAEQRIDV